MTRPRILIEDWLPVATLGAESQRDASAAQKPPTNRLHVWWARRPLTTSRGAILASLLPSWDDLPDRAREEFGGEEAYRAWFLRLCGILGDPVAGRERIERAKLTGERLKGNPYGHPRAFTVNPEPEDLERLRTLLLGTWGTEMPVVADPMAGGGSIPFEALRYGFPALANELNPVAAVILHATLDFPFRFGSGLVNDLRHYGQEVARRVEERLDRLFPRQAGESVFAYLWARTVACPTTGKPVPLSPNWWLQKGSHPVAVRLIADPGRSLCTFEILEGSQATAARPDEGTVSRGVGRSPWTGDAIPGDYIKAEAQAGRMGQQLYAVVVKTAKGTQFRAPTDEDLAAVRAAEQELARRRPGWEAAGLVPDEDIPEGNKTAEPIRYGMTSWRELFSPRQLLTLMTYLEAIREVGEELSEELEPERARAIQTYLTFMHAKAANYNSRMVRWHSSRGVVAGTFDRHDFSFKWSHGEFDGAHNLWPWVLDQVVDAYRGLTKLARDSGATLFAEQKAPPVTFTGRNAASLPDIPAGSVHLVCVDPPYGANVMYAELSDFFYVWQKRSIGHLYPQLFRAALTDKDEEAVANPARFARIARGRREELAQRDYERKMAACFAEMRRILADDGVLTVMFTHKEVETWNSLATSLIEAGFMVETSWPVHTESEHSLHQAKKNAAQSTILLACRKRPQTSGPVWWDDIQGEVRETARTKARDFQEAGMQGVDLYLSTFGPVLAVISSRWPVYTGEVDEQTGKPKVLRPEAALDLARREVIELRKRGLLGRQLEFDPITDWYIMAWDAFRAEQFPADEARKLAIVLDLELDSDLVRRRLIDKRGKMVAFVPPTQRRRDGIVDPEVTSFTSLVDAVHTAMLVYSEDGDRACGAFLSRAGLLRDHRFRSCLQAMMHVVPRTSADGRFVRPEAELLEAFRLRWFEELTIPVETITPDGPVQATLDEVLRESSEQRVGP